MGRQMKTEIDPDLKELIDTIPHDSLLSVKQVAGVVGRCPEYVRGLIEMGELKVINGQGKIRNNYLIYRSSLIRYLKKHTA